MIRASYVIAAYNEISENWGEKIANDILEYTYSHIITPMTCAEFLDNCTACGGNWGGMFLTGIKKLYPEVWDMIPEDMGAFAFGTICDTLILLHVDTSE